MNYRMTENPEDQSMTYMNAGVSNMGFFLDLMRISEYYCSDYTTNVLVRPDTQKNPLWSPPSFGS